MPSFPYKTTGLLTYTSKVNNVATDAVTITVQVYKPDGTALWGSAKTPSDTGVGTYEQEITAVEANVIGRWTAVWTWTYSTSSHTDVEEFWVTGDVEPTGLVGLCTLEQVKAYVSITATTDDTRIADLITSATKSICKKYEREFVPQGTATRTFKLKTRLLDLTPYDLRSVTTMKIHPEASSPTTLAVTTDYILLPIGAEPGTSVYTKIRIGPDVDMTSDYSDDYGFAQLEINGAWGIWASEATVPDDVRWAAIQTVLSWLDRPSSQIAGVNDFGEPRQLNPTMGGTWSIPNAAHEIFKRYQRFYGVY